MNFSALEPDGFGYLEFFRSQKPPQQGALKSIEA